MTEAHIRVDTHGARLLALLLPTCKQLVSLSLGNAPVCKDYACTWDGGEYVISGLTELTKVFPMTNIESLDLEGSDIYSEYDDGPELFEAWVAMLPQTKILSLNLSSNDLGDDGCRALAAVLPQTKIASLDLSSNGISAEGGQALAAVLPQTNITSLKLNANELDEEAKQALRAAAGSGVSLSLSDDEDEDEDKDEEEAEDEDEEHEAGDDE